ncbi:hypothetical protein N8306_04825 [Yoonia sp.]|nr:hypothetical protein [Yoonia sp.]
MVIAKVSYGWVSSFLLVSLAYVVAFLITLYGLQPIQAAYTPGLAEYASLMFLPHGVRVLTAWLFGWSSIFLIAPAALYTHWLIFGSDGFSALGVAGAVSGVVAAPLCFWLFFKLGFDVKATAKRPLNWRDVMLVGCFASLVNTAGIGYAFEHNLGTMIAYLIGDITGLFVCMFVLMIIFKLMSNSQAR